MLPELVSLCRQTVTVAPRTGVDGYGEPTYGAAVSYRARVTGRRRVVRNARGEEVLSAHTGYFAATPAGGAHDRITLSTGDVNSTETGAVTPEVIAVGKFPDDLGGVSLVAYLA